LSFSAQGASEKGVHVRVAVDEARRHHAPLGVDHLARALADAADRGDAAALHGHVRAVTGQAGAVDEQAVLDDEVVRHRAQSSLRSKASAKRR
jgi:hypothetical protein